MVFGLLLASCPAWGQAIDGPSWEMGWVTDVDPKYVVDLEEDWDLTGELVAVSYTHLTLPTICSV